MIKIYVMSKVQMKDFIEFNKLNDENIEYQTDIAIISINDNSNSFWGIPFFNVDHLNVLNLKFDDVDVDIKECKAFTREQALKTIDFLSSQKNRKTLLIHCAAGISRSGAIGQFAIHYLNGDKEHFRLKNSHILPNNKVLRELNNIANGYYDI